MSVTIGWWALPTVITLAVIAYGFVPERQTYYGADIIGALKLLVGFIIALISWLIWALVA